MLESKKSIIYSVIVQRLVGSHVNVCVFCWLILKTVMTMYQEMPDVKVMRIADTTSLELLKELSNQ